MSISSKYLYVVAAIIAVVAVAAWWQTAFSPKPGPSTESKEAPSGESQESGEEQREFAIFVSADTKIFAPDPDNPRLGLPETREPESEVEALAFKPFVIQGVVYTID